MLALTRRVGQSIVISDDIEITVISMSQDHVKLGVEAPRSIPVYRKEIFVQIKAENESANLVSDKSKQALKDLLAGADKNEQKE